MSFATAFALLLSLFVAAPVVAHLLRRRRTDVVPFPPARLVVSTPPVARRRSRLEDRSLFGVRALVIVALALLGATPFVHCSRLSVGRRGGGSVGLVLILDDSLSMRARLGDGTRFSRAVQGAKQILAAAREGDSIALIAAGAPARILLASTTDIAAARNVLDTVAESDRSTDLDEALALATSLARVLPQADRRLVLLSDLADGKGIGAPPLGSNLDLPLWIPLQELAQQASDCGLVRAERRSGKVRVHVACGSDRDATGREIACMAGDQIISRASLHTEHVQDLELASSGTEPKGPDHPCTIVRLSGSDAIAADDTVAVVATDAPMAVAVVSDIAQSGVATGGPPPVEQALNALTETLVVHPLPTVPDDAEDLAAYAAVVLDDPPGLTPEARSAFRAWLVKGGAGLLLLGPRAAHGMLGASFEPFFLGPVRWETSCPAGVEQASATWFGPSVDGLSDLHSKGRALLGEAKAAEGAQVLARWVDSAPLVLARTLERGEAITVTLPGGANESDFPLRPAFLTLLDHILERAQTRGNARRSTVGSLWTLSGIEAVKITLVGSNAEVPVREQAGVRTAVPSRAGVYAIHRSNDVEMRIAEIADAEVDLTPRAALPETTSAALGSAHARLDASPYVAMVLLLAIAAEAGVRLWMGRR